MKILKILLLFIFFCSSIHIGAQDDYHQALLDQLQNDYGISGGTFNISTDHIANNLAAWNYGQDGVTYVDIADESFSHAVNADITVDYENAWNAGWGITNEQAIQENDVCLLVYWARTATGAEGRLNIFAENNVTYQKEVYRTFPVGLEWRQYLVPFVSSASYDVGAFQFGFHIGAAQQNVQFTGINIINYQNAYAEEDLPNIRNNDVYGGYEADAPWRFVAQENIESLRKANIQITVNDNNGNPLENAGVAIQMMQHEYAFGTAVVSCAIAGNDCQDDIYESKLLDLDGKGHGFNWVVFENGLKWDAWESQWPTSQFEKADAIDWLKAKDIKVRGHNLLWPGRWYLPNDVRLNIANTDYVLERIDEHLEEILNYPSIKGELAEWDVLNEITVERFLEDSLAGNNGFITGREIYLDVLNKTKAIDDSPKLYINDYMTISSQRSKGPVYDRYQGFIQEIIDAGAPLDGIGFQAHIGTYPTSIYQVEDILSDFYEKFGLKQKITEFDIDGDAGDEVEAAYMRDFLTYIFSHPSTDGFLMWGFWDGAHWKDNAPMFDEDWNLKPSGQAFIDLVFNEWWTDKFETTAANGVINTDGYKGKYIIQVNCDEVILDTVDLSDDGIDLVYNCQELSSINEFSDNSIALYPNPSTGNARLKRSSTGLVTINVFSQTGHIVHTFQSTNQNIELLISPPKGSYVIELVEDKSVKRLNWIVQ